MLPPTKAPRMPGLLIGNASINAISKIAAPLITMANPSACRHVSLLNRNRFEIDAVEDEAGSMIFSACASTFLFATFAWVVVASFNRSVR